MVSGINFHVTKRGRLKDFIYRNNNDYNGKIITIMGLRTKALNTY
jgi:hypothetical protein